jgi:hypothetical protein
MIELEKLTKAYGGNRAVEALSFRIETNEIFGLLGLSPEPCVHKPAMARRSELFPTPLWPTTTRLSLSLKSTVRP